MGYFLFKLVAVPALGGASGAPTSGPVHLYGNLGLTICWISKQKKNHQTIFFDKLSAGLPQALIPSKAGSDWWKYLEEVR